MLAGHLGKTHQAPAAGVPLWQGAAETEETAICAGTPHALQELRGALQSAASICPGAHAGQQATLHAAADAV